MEMEKEGDGERDGERRGGEPHGKEEGSGILHQAARVRHNRGACLHDGSFSLVVATEFDRRDGLGVKTAALLLHDPRHRQPDEEVLEVLAQQRLTNAVVRETTVPFGSFAWRKPLVFWRKARFL